MNIASDEVIRSLFFNKHNQNLITVSVYSGDNYTSLRCRTTPLECANPSRTLPQSTCLARRWLRPLRIPYALCQRQIASR